MRPERLSLVALAMIVSACASQAVPSTIASPASSSVVASASVRPSPSPSPSPSATPDEEAIRRVAATAYLAATRKVDTELAALNKGYPGKTFASLSIAHAYYKASAAITGTLIAALRKISVPSDATAHMQALIARNAELQAIDIDLSTTTAAEYQGAFNIYVDRGRAATAAADLIRVDLGLPSVK